MLKSQLISDVILRISASKPSDDLELEPTQVAFWIDQVLNALVKTTLDEKIKNKEGVDGEYILVDYNLNVNKSLSNGKAVYFLDLSAEPMNLYRDGGIIRVGNSDTFDVVDKVKMSELDTVKNLRFSKPSLKNIQYTRVKSKLYLQGIDDDSYQLNNFDVAFVPKTKVLEELEDDDIIYVAEDLIPVIAQQVTQLAKDEILNEVGDTTNDADDDAQPLQTK